MTKPPTTQNQLSADKIFISIAIVFGLSLLFFIVWMSQFFNLSLSKFILQFKNSLFYPNMNQFVVGEIGNKNVLVLFYWFLFFSILLVGIYFMIFLYSPGEKQDISFLQIIPITLIMGLLLFSIVQQFHRYDYFKYEKKIFGGKTTHEKNLAYFGDLYQFPHMVQEVLKNRHQAEFITDTDLQKSPYMFHHRVLSYFFYPKLSTRLDNQTPNNTLFLYYKKNPLAHIPSDYTVLLSTDDKGHVFAIEKGALK